MNNKHLKPYMAFSRSAGSVEGAILVFAHTAKEAKKISAPFLYCWNVEEWTDLAVRLLRKSDHLFLEADQEKLLNGIPHVIDNPRLCSSCEQWGNEIGDDGLCAFCREEEINDDQ